MKKVIPIILLLSIALAGTLVFAEMNCTETDDGQDYSKKGTRTIACTTEDECETETNTDKCLDDETLLEYYCENDGSTGAEEYACRYGCKAGACEEGTCNSENLHLCWDPNPCRQAGGHWYNYGCHEEAQQIQANDNETDDNSVGLGQMINNRVWAGNYTAENGVQIRVRELAQNRLRLQVGNFSADCDCNLTQEQVQNRTRFYVNLTNNGRNAEIKVMPDVASQTALARLRLKVCSEQNNCTLELKEVGQGNQTRLSYELQLERHYRILGLFRAKAQNRIQVDAENGEVIQTQTPWWSFLASKDDGTEDGK